MDPKLANMDMFEVNVKFPFKVTIHPRIDALEWCRESLGADGLDAKHINLESNWGWLFAEGEIGRPTFYFTNDRDAVEFKLRFG